MVVPFHSGAPFEILTVPFRPPLSCQACGQPGYALPLEEMQRDVVTGVGNDRVVERDGADCTH